ncbi:MAG: hypothetical protein KFF73_15850 [Cyclobacteriaceae bacterium]|nr:hypothetical protein [Cyclobacteriaceae bacterium]
MGNFSLILVTALFLIFTCSCDAQTSTQHGEEMQIQAETVDVYYFHFAWRCVTCTTVEAEAREAVETLYPQLYKDKKITFEAVNLDEDSGRKMAEEYGVSGQSLLIVSGSEKADLIREGFMYARTDPDKFRQAIKQQIDGML